MAIVRRDVLNALLGIGAVLACGRQLWSEQSQE
jgi:hypothetical protein